MKIYASIVLLALLPTPANAIIADLFSFVLSIFFGDWRGKLCDSLTENFDSFSSDCPCSVDLSGFLDYDISVGCEDISSTGCDIELGAGGNIFSAVFGGDSSFEGSTTCDLAGVVDLSLGLGGSVALGGAELSTCNVEITSSVVGTSVEDCDCNLGCDPDEPFSAQLQCDLVTSVGTLTDALSFPCGNILEIIDDLNDITSF